MKVVAEVLPEILNWLGLSVICFKILVNGDLMDSQLAAMVKLGFFVVVIFCYYSI